MQDEAALVVMSLGARVAAAAARQSAADTKRAARRLSGEELPGVRTLAAYERRVLGPSILRGDVRPGSGNPHALPFPGSVALDRRQGGGLRRVQIQGGGATSRYPRPRSFDGDNFSTKRKSCMDSCGGSNGGWILSISCCGSVEFRGSGPESWPKFSLDFEKGRCVASSDCLHKPC